MEIDHKYACEVYAKKKLYWFKILDMTTLRIFEVMWDRFNIFGICISGNYT